MTDLGHEKYVSFTTFRRSGEAVSTPVWIADLGDGAIGFTTAVETGKAKRLRHTDRVEVRPSDFRGRVRKSAPTRTGSARLVEGDDAERVRAAIKQKYGWMFTLTRLAYKLMRRPMADVGVVVTLDD